MHHFILLPVCCQITVGSLACLSLAALCAGGGAGQQAVCGSPDSLPPLRGAPHPACWSSYMEEKTHQRCQQHVMALKICRGTFSKASGSVKERDA
ncbi:hypothetical protein E2C01_017967 [Portunus trituberculatus]|uniref:Secreted protein n=1 Tax=Portunus trituberculatus TaxID=210409 RepID=A0A5B7DVF7_PORTR|nr:hypothetical protein [Portunus trituberculatus]